MSIFPRSGTNFIGISAGGGGEWLALSSANPNIQAGTKQPARPASTNLVSDSASGLFFHVTEW